MNAPAAFPAAALAVDPWELLDSARLVLAVHAHPDDESLSTGALLASLVAAGTQVVLVTATRGEEGEIVTGSVAADDPRPIEEIREHEIEAATRALGILERHWLGTAPALASGAKPRRYRDSGMQWVREAPGRPLRDRRCRQLLPSPPRTRRRGPRGTHHPAAARCGHRL